MQWLFLLLLLLLPCAAVVHLRDVRRRWLGGCRSPTMRHCSGQQQDTCCLPGVDGVNNNA